MKNLNRALFVIFGACMCILFMAAESKAQCQKCEIVAEQWFCANTESGGSLCKTVGPSCTVTGICLNGDRMSPGNCKIKSLANPMVSISDAMIREVGAGDARLAIALIDIRDIKVQFDVARVNFTSVEYTFDDVENHLTQIPGSSYFDQLKQRMKDSYAKNANTVTYEVSVTTGRGGPSSLSVSLTGGGGKSIEIELQPATFGKGKDISEGFKALSYHIK